MSSTPHCPFCYQEFESVAAVIAHVEGQLCISNKIAHSKEDLYYRIETSLLRVEVQIRQNKETSGPDGTS
jgi:hypothetical protein